MAGTIVFGASFTTGLLVGQNFNADDSQVRFNWW